MAASKDLPPPQWGPAFLRANSAAYRLEYAVGTVVLLALLIGWRGAVEHALSLEDILLSVLWFLWPDLLAFLPIGLAMRGGKAWPRWGPTLYNVPHSLFTWALVFVSWSLLANGIAWPLLAWAAHITLDRSVGYHLRSSELGSPKPTPP